MWMYVQLLEREIWNSGFLNIISLKKVIFVFLFPPLSLVFNLIHISLCKEFLHWYWAVQCHSVRSPASPESLWLSRVALWMTTMSPHHWYMCGGIGRYTDLNTTTYLSLNTRILFNSFALFLKKYNPDMYNRLYFIWCFVSICHQWNKWISLMMG